MRICLLTIIIVFTTIPLKAIESYYKGDTLYNWAASGLKLRSAKSFEGEIIAIIPFGAKVEMLSEKYDDLEDYFLNDHYMLFHRDEHDSTYYNMIRLEGNWAQVEYKDKIGWVFDCYLSRLKVDEGFGGNNISIFSYFQKHYGFFPDFDSQNDYRSTGTHHYDLGNMGHAIEWLDDNKGSLEMIFYDLSFEEFFLLISTLRNHKMGISGNQHIKEIKKNLKYKELTIEGECGGYHFFEINNKLFYKDFRGC